LTGRFRACAAMLVRVVNPDDERAKPHGVVT